MNTTIFKASYKVLPQYKLILEFVEGTITLESYKSYEMKLVNDPLYNPSFDVYVDLRNVLFDGTIDQMNEYGAFVLENINIVKNRKNATIINNLHQHIYTQLFGNFNDAAKVPQEFRLFTDPFEAINWLHIPYSINQLDEIKKEMMMSPQYVKKIEGKY